MTKLIDLMKGIYGSHMKEYQRKKHNYPIMDLYLLVYGEVRVTMEYYLKNIVSEFTETIQEIVVTTEAYNLFTVREYNDRKLLDKYRSTEFHNSVAKLLFVTPCVKKDI